MEDPPAAGEGRRQLGGAFVVLGLALIVWAVLYMNVSALGRPPERRTFANRRPYDQVKRSAHEAFPGFLLRAGMGGLSIFIGARLRRRRPTS